MNSAPTTVLEFSDEGAWCHAVLEAMAASVESPGERHVCLSGGSTPHPLYSALGKSRLPWERVRWWLGDERVNPGQRNDSAILNSVNHPHFAARLERWREGASPLAAAADYEARLRGYFPEGAPQFDFLLLGLGDDGHTASLFPGAPELDEREALCVATREFHLGCQRLTLTYPAFERARHTWFLVRGEGKASVVRQFLDGSRELPAARVCGERRVLAWLRESRLIGSAGILT